MPTLRPPLQQTRPPLLRATLGVAALLAMTAAIGALLAILHAGHPAQAHLVHSDALYLPVLFEDILRRGGSLGDWFLTPAPYFFPDFPLYLLAWLGGAGIASQLTAFALLQTLCLAGALQLVLRRLVPAASLAATAALTALFILLGLHADDPFVRLFSSAHHYGAFLAALLLGALWLALDTDAGTKRKHQHALAAAVAILVFLTTLSDALFLVQAVAPLAAAAWLSGRSGALGPRSASSSAPGASPLRRIALLLVLPALLAMLSYRFVVAHPTRYPSRLGLSRLAANAEELGTICATLFGPRPLLAAALLCTLLAGAACAFACLRPHRPVLAWLARPPLLILVFATCSTLATAAVMLLSTNVQPVPRYLIAPLSWLLVAGAALLARLLGRHFGAAALALALLFAGLLGHEAWRLRGAGNSAQYFYPPQIACIDAALAAGGASHGIAQYWDAKRLQGLSRQDLTLAQYTGDLARMDWITSQRFYRERYDFAILAPAEAPAFRLPLQQLTAINGPALRTVHCGDRSVLLFGKGRLRTVPAASTSAAAR